MDPNLRGFPTGGQYQQQGAFPGIGESGRCALRRDARELRAPTHQAKKQDVLSRFLWRRCFPNAPAAHRI